jgi:hypothetical protein
VFHVQNLLISKSMYGLFCTYLEARFRVCMKAGTLSCRLEGRRNSLSLNLPFELQSQKRWNQCEWAVPGSLSLYMMIQRRLMRHLSTTPGGLHC